MLQAYHPNFKEREETVKNRSLILTLASKSNRWRREEGKKKGKGGGRRPNTVFTYLVSTMHRRKGGRDNLGSPHLRYVREGKKDAVHSRSLIACGERGKES